MYNPETKILSQRGKLQHGPGDMICPDVVVLDNNVIRLPSEPLQEKVENV